MWNNFLISVEAVLPIFLTMGVGILIKKSGIIKPDQVKALNKVVFIACFSCLMFTNIYGREFSDTFERSSMIFAAISVSIIYILSTLFTLAVEKKPKSRGAMIQAIYRSNFVIMGIPIVSNIFGPEKCALTAGLIMVIVPMYNILAVVTLEVYRGSKPNVAHIIKSVLKNPLIVGAITGFIFTLLKIQLPDFIISPITGLADAATPIALLVLGMSFSKSSIKEGKRNIIIVVIARLVVVPALALSAAILFGFRDVALVSMIAIFAAPCAISSFTMAQEMDSDADLAGNCVVFTSLFACFTMFFWIFILKCMGMF